MTLLLLGLAIFLGGHAFAMARGPRHTFIERIGEGRYKALFSIVSFIGLILIIVGFGRYRAAGYIPVWDPPVWTRHLALLLLWPAFVMLFAAYLPGRIKRALKHPMLAAVKVWALAHLLANGDLGSMLLFGLFLAWAVAARIAAKRRDEAVPHGAPMAEPAGGRNDLLAVGLGTAVYLAFVFWLHPLLIGVPVLPGRGA